MGMFIEELVIQNFRGLDLSISGLCNEVLIIGKNDSGKTNLCYAIRKLLDYNIRIISLNEQDSTNSNRLPIKISIKIDLSSITDENKSLLASKCRSCISSDGENEYLKITLTAEFNKETLHYDETITYGEEDTKQFSISNTNPIDYVLDFIYFDSSYDINEEKRIFFKSKQKESIDEKDSESVDIINSVDSLNDAIINVERISNINKNLNALDNDYSGIFEDTNFEIKSNIDIANIYKSLDVVAVSPNGTQINIGDGKAKTLSMMLKNMTHKSAKQKIIILEEPENHLYPLLQKHFIDLLFKFNPDQIICTTHSPYIIDFKKTKQIIRLSQTIDGLCHKTVQYLFNINSKDFEEYGYCFDEQLASMLFYNFVLLVEGYSEKYFYNRLANENNEFKEYLVKNKMGIFPVYGIAFSKVKKMLEGLGIKVLVKTDNDIYINRKYFAGYARAYNFLDENVKKEFKNIIGLQPSNEVDFHFVSIRKSIIEVNSSRIIELMNHNGIILSKHHDGFERDFVDFIGIKDNKKDTINYLKEAKLKNLHQYIVQHDIKLEINKRNKKSPLIRFMYD